ncbi:predicted protein [Lodderomyces elongisporus NRRL YB-4239]|uniref:Cytochrome c oxidase copper chaperone n=1 Tax=Lodderomyces elongisporus (strain ATCC 11503 / CBS 2605 / JCM 1781 / NBRC 1676 / NRRL YB-4239) TaxID=379508 RepID=A5DUX2_LODEL|nr:predicted protein [Lodderomyces elongisporus NRRL YB-4239]
MAGQEQQKKEENKPKPCCVCIKEREERDKCALFHGVSDDNCKPQLEAYWACMKSYNFQPNSSVY